MISQDKKMLLRKLKKLEREREEGSISEEEYRSLREQYTRELETLEAVENIRRLQGQETPEKPLDHWVEESRIEKDRKEKEELIKKYVRTEGPRRGSRPNLSLIGAIVLVVAFLFGTGFGLYFMNIQPETPATGTVTVNESAFPSSNNTVKNVTVTSNKTFNQENTTPQAPSTPSTPSTPQDNQGTGGTGGTQNPPSSP